LTNYQIGIDWAGIVLERSTGMSLNNYLHQFIFAPLGLKNISMLPTPSMKQNLVHMSSRAPDGQLSQRDHLLRYPLIVETAEEKKNCFNSGGAGCFAKPQEYCRE
jgi:CubicO group peptidase (beta-lactamase class C family)